MDRLMEDALDAASLRPDKRALQRVIESAIEEMSPDLLAAEEILAVLIATLKSRYYDLNEMDNVQWNADALTISLRDAADEAEEIEYVNDTDMRQNDDQG